MGELILSIILLIVCFSWIISSNLKGKLRFKGGQIYSLYNNNINGENSEKIREDLY